ncbi:hypothetical protein PB01_11935 [Psychrobacillus glaciei]|uniref:Uncharacterized protein n=1 Tax=Psychrobacillus glaciei TaxID=2283160 RepID=A0A5J6SN83_9BACI|nr:hypothetical protein [Psychrobacillus glaciei]QFF99480.1 hypothetical protein PB01_11935 [Psychrobacillus glaciei]
MNKLFPLHASIMIENFSEIILDYEITILRLKENNLVCAYDDFLLEIQANALEIKSLSMEQLRIVVDELMYFKITRKEKQ